MGWLLGSFLVGMGLAVSASGEGSSPKNPPPEKDFFKPVDRYEDYAPPGVDFSDRIHAIPCRSPEESLKAFHTLPGFQIDLVAAEPMVHEAADIAFDENGRLWVVELLGFPPRVYKRYPGKVRVLDDTDGDGRFDKSTVFIDHLTWPTGILPYDGGVFITSAPDILYCKDTDGDDKADVREVVVTGFPMDNLNAVPNSPRWGLDNRIHGLVSLAGGNLRALRWEKNTGQTEPKPVRARGRDFSLHPRTGELRLETGGSQYGMYFDQWGRKFEASNSNHLQMIFYDDRYFARNPHLAPPPGHASIAADGPDAILYRKSPFEPWRLVRTELRNKGLYKGVIHHGGKPSGYFSAACGLLVYTGHLWPKEFHGNVLVTDVGCNVIHRKRLDPDGVGFRGHRVEKNREFVASEEIWFRPIQLNEGPDGNVYVADMYRQVIEDPDFFPSSVWKHMDCDAGRDRGRVWRIAPEGFKPSGLPRLGELSTGELVGLLEHPNGWHRRVVGRLLYERRDPKCLDPLRNMAAQSTSALARMHALYALEGQEALTSEVLLARLGDEHPRVREHAIKLAEKFLKESPALEEKLCAMVDDPDIRVRYQLAFTLGEIPGDRATDALVAIARRDCEVSYIRYAIYTSIVGRTGDLFVRLAGDLPWRRTQIGRDFLSWTAEMAGRHNRPAQLDKIFQALEQFPEDEKELAKSVIRGLRVGLEASGSPLLERLTEAGNTRRGRILAEMIKQAEAGCIDPKRPVAKRVEAIRTLALAPAEVAESLLAELLDGRQPKEVQLAALGCLATFNHDQVAPIILDAWPGFSPPVRREATEALFARRERLQQLLDALGDGHVAPSQLEPARIQYLRDHSDPSIRGQAERLLSEVTLIRRGEVVADYKEVLGWKADASRGREVFRGECATCHRLEDVGYDLGLPLKNVARRGPEGIMLAVLDPNCEILPEYVNYVVITEDGRSLTGMIAAETSTSITLRRAEGESDTVLRTDIDELHNTGMSIMPEGLEKQVPKQDMADLIAYLMQFQ